LSISLQSEFAGAFMNPEVDRARSEAACFSFSLVSSLIRYPPSGNSLLKADDGMVHRLNGSRYGWLRL
jgi:hypothetical protein